MASEDWIWEFFPRHIERIPRGDWPASDSAFWVTFRDRLVSLNVTETVADAASELLAEDSPRYLDQHIREFKHKVHLVWAKSEVAAPRKPVHPRDPADDAWNAAAQAKWDGLPERKRQEWRSLVLERLPEVARWPQFVEGIAIAWCYDPEQVPPPPPALAPKHSPSAGRPTGGRTTERPDLYPKGF